MMFCESNSSRRWFVIGSLRPGFDRRCRRSYNDIIRRSVDSS